jgi:antitoxin YefM
MYSIYRTNVDELDMRFINALKTQFTHKELEIAVCEITQIEEDETNYLRSSPANQAHLLKAIDNIAHHRNLVTVDLDNLS